MKFIERKHEEYIQKMTAAAPGANFSLLSQFQPITKSMVAHSHETGGNVLGLEDVVASGPAINWLIAVTVDTVENQKKIDPLTREYRDAVDTYATRLGVNKDWVYLNYALGDQDPLKYYGSENIKLLQAVSQKYDPKGVFQKLRSSGFKLPA